MNNSFVVLVFTDGATYSGPNELAVVKQMRDSGRFTVGKTVHEYMRGYAYRRGLLFPSDPPIHTGSAGQFLLSIARTVEVKTLIVTHVTDE